MGEVTAVSSDGTHKFSKPNRAEIQLLTGLGVAGDAHLGENVTTSGVDLLALPTGTRLWLGETAVVEVTGLRNPCLQLDLFQSGLMKATLDRDADGTLIRKAGVMSIVLAEGVVRPGDKIQVELPSHPHQPLQPV